MGAKVLSFSPDDKVSDIVAALRRDGAAIVRNVVTPEVMDSLSEKVNRGDQQGPADRLDPIRLTMIVDEGHHHLGRRPSFACAKYADALRRISFARRSSRFSFSSSAIRARSSVVIPGFSQASTRVL